MHNELPNLALFQPDIPQNAGTLLRLSACLGVAVEVIEPCGFLWDERRMRRAGMDYLDSVRVRRHSGFTAFTAAMEAEGRRLVLLTTKADLRLDRFSFERRDVIMVGRESVGVPPEVIRAARISLRIPMAAGMRSLNVALAATLALGAALGQFDAFPGDP